ncbi:heterokaryon incompatibility protein-domain-containing protein [Massariosphaeria phaeospora]|uniref:Heterokaryon incompatibility protein-domain-containing protein n=1 Tax=Massariosphaeria phaeospora TaxID=100035 RepID=A0A7C8ME59_9PLEO|nr:heterokaryon incompatibility protein-domain-containing protein [Massariosphaeria phaeospora]
MESTEAYTYTPLPTTEDATDTCIRLLTLMPSPENDASPITCSITTTPLSQAPPYGAVSYCWGDATNQHTIHVAEPDGEGSSSLQVPATLIPFFHRTRSLTQFRDCEQTMMLWIDSICIDQSCNLEKERQVARMRDIYARASTTHIWLGEESDSSTLALSYAQSLRRDLEERVGKDVVLKQVLRSRAKPAELPVGVGDARLEAFFRLLERPWFTRAWVVQEVVVSQNAHVMCGATSQPWPTLWLAFVYLMGCHTWLWNFYPARRLWQFLAPCISQREWRDGTELQWWRLLARHRSCAATDRRDKVFSLWGLKAQRQFKDMGIEPNYSESAETLYTKLAIAALQRGQTEVLSIPRLVRTPKTHLLNTPTWVPDWAHTPSTPSTLIQCESSTTTWTPPWRASSNSTFTPTFSTPSPPGSLPTKLCLRGYTIGRITRLTPLWRDAPPAAANPTLVGQARIKQFTQRQIRAWETVLLPHRPYSLRRLLNPSFLAAYPPAPSYSLLRAAHTTLFGGVLLNGDDAKMRFAMLYFLVRQLCLYPLRVLPTWCIWPWMLVVLLSSALKPLGYVSPDMLFSTHGAGSPMVNRRAGRVRGASGAEYMALLPGVGYHRAAVRHRVAFYQKLEDEQARALRQN